MSHRASIDDRPRFDERFDLEDRIASEILTYEHPAVAAIADIVRPEHFNGRLARAIVSAALRSYHSGGKVTRERITAGGLNTEDALEAHDMLDQDAPPLVSGAAALRERAERVVRLAGGQPQPAVGAGLAVDGASFILDQPDEQPAVWGEGSAVVWAKGEPLYLVGPTGVGKTTLAQQLVLARIGLRGELLRMPVEREPRRVLYVAADRPRQAQRSFRRMVTERDRAGLATRLVFWRGPLPFDLAAEPKQLANLAREYDAGTVVIDSLKDVAVELGKDETGSKVNLALQTAIAAEIEILVLHHQRKEQHGAGKPRRLADVYGSSWLVAGAGSVVILWGDAGDPVVELTHLKQPIDEVGPFKVIHDKDTGRSRVHDRPDIVDLVRISHRGVTVRTAACHWFSSESPTDAQIEKARYQLDRLVKRGQAWRDDGNPVRYQWQNGSEKGSDTSKSLTPVRVAQEGPEGSETAQNQGSERGQKGQTAGGQRNQGILIPPVSDPGAGEIDVRSPE
jgi:KaiC/GvpD/RAD55 family RecA-like ATPase